MLSRAKRELVDLELTRTRSAWGVTGIPSELSASVNIRISVFTLEKEIKFGESSKGVLGRVNIAMVQCPDCANIWWS